MLFFRRLPSSIVVIKVTLIFACNLSKLFTIVIIAISPAAIMKIMYCHNNSLKLSRVKVASHLQKYRSDTKQQTYPSSSPSGPSEPPERSLPSIGIIESPSNSSVDSDATEFPLSLAGFVDLNPVSQYNSEQVISGYQSGYYGPTQEYSAAVPVHLAVSALGCPVPLHYCPTCGKSLDKFL